MKLVIGARSVPEILSTHRVSDSRKAERLQYIDKTFKMPSELEEIEQINNRVANMLGKNLEKTNQFANLQFDNNNMDPEATGRQPPIMTPLARKISAPIHPPSH